MNQTLILVLALIIKESEIMAQYAKNTNVSSELKITEFQKEVHANAVLHGWHEEERSFGDLIALCHAELSEALEEYRNKRSFNDTYYSCSKKGEPTCNTMKTMPYMCEGCKDRKPEGIPSELADVVIRIMDMCELYGIDLEETMRIKHEFNKTRPYKHGGKLI